MIKSKIVSVAAAMPIFLLNFGFGGKAEARQCVYNKAGFVLNVQWYESGDVEGRQVSTNKWTITAKNPPVKKQNITAGFKSCVDSNDSTAVLSVVGGKTADVVTKAAAVTALTLGTAVTCVATVGAGCPAAAELAGATAIEIAIALPSNAKLFSVTKPSTDTNLDVIGTVWKPALRTGGKIK